MKKLTLNQFQKACDQAWHNHKEANIISASNDFNYSCKAISLKFDKQIKTLTVDYKFIIGIKQVIKCNDLDVFFFESSDGKDFTLTYK